MLFIYLFSITNVCLVLPSYNRILFTYFRVAKSCIDEKLYKIGSKISFQDILAKKLNLLFKSTWKWYFFQRPHVAVSLIICLKWYFTTLNVKHRHNCVMLNLWE